MRIGIVGAGASGTLASALLARRGFEVHLFEKEEPLRKVLATGNGRCNFTNENMGPEFYTGEESEEVAELLECYSPERIKDFFLTIGVPSRTLPSGMVYPYSMRAEGLVHRLLAELEASGAYLHTGVEITSVQEKGAGFLIRADKEFYVDKLVLSTGGSKGLKKKDFSNGYGLAKSFGHSLTKRHPGIVALETGEAIPRYLSGIKVEAELKIPERTVRDDLLFTKEGISGIGVLKVSNETLDRPQGQREIAVDFLPDYSLEEVQNMWKSLEEVYGGRPEELLEGLLPKEVIKWAYRDGKHFPRNLKHKVFRIRDTREGDYGQVTCGGVPLNEVDLMNMGSKLKQNLYLIGEILNVQGICGGYNLHWAWTSAFCLAERMEV